MAKYELLSLNYYPQLNTLIVIDVIVGNSMKIITIIDVINFFGASIFGLII